MTKEDGEIHLGDLRRGRLVQKKDHFNEDIFVVFCNTPSCSPGHICNTLLG